MIVSDKQWKKSGFLCKVETVRMSFQPAQQQFCFSRTCCAQKKKHNRRELGLFKEEICCIELICLCSKTYCCWDSYSNKFKFGSKNLNKRTLEISRDRPTSKYCRVLYEIFRVTSTNRGFRTTQHDVATYEQTKKRFSYFQPKRNVQQDGIHAPLIYN